MGITCDLPKTSWDVLVIRSQVQDLFGMYVSEMQVCYDNSSMFCWGFAWEDMLSQKNNNKLT